MKKVDIYNELCKELNNDKYGDDINYKTIIFALEKVTEKTINFEELSLCVYDNSYMNNIRSSFCYIDINFDNMPYKLDLDWDCYLGVNIFNKNTKSYNKEVEEFPSYVYLEDFDMYIRSDKNITKKLFINSLMTFRELVKFKDAFTTDNNGQQKFFNNKYEKEKKRNSFIVDFNHALAHSFWFGFLTLITVDLVIWIVGFILIKMIDKHYYINEMDDSYIDDEVFTETILEWIGRVHKDIPFEIDISTIEGVRDIIMSVNLSLDDEYIYINQKNMRKSTITDEEKINIQNEIEKYQAKQEIEARFSMQL